MRRLLIACSLLLPLALPGLARTASLDDLAFAVRAPGRCMDAAASAAPTFTLNQLAPRREYCLQAQFDVARQPAAPQVLQLSALAASDIFLDGVQVGSNGVPAGSAAGEREGMIDYRLTLLPRQLAPGRHTLVLHMSTWHASSQLRSLFHALSLQDPSSLHAGALASLAALLLAGALALAALLFCGLLARYQRSGRWTVFLLLCVVACALLLTEAWRSLANYPYSWHLPRLWAVTILSAAFALLLPAYYLLAYGITRTLHVLVALALGILCAAMAGPGFDAKAALMFMLALLASALINLWAWRRRRKGGLAGVTVSLLSIGVFLLQGTDFARTGFALVVFLLLATILVQLLRRFVRERERAALASRFENQLLRKSLQPHFLMNALSLIGELMHQSPARAERYVEALGREMRMLGEVAHRATITLDEELALCRNYLEIMSTRFQRRFTLDVQGAAGTLRLPPAVLLTSLENAFSHNRYGHDVAFTLLIDSPAGRLQLSTPPAPARAHAGGGTGFDYIRLSLAEAFGAAAGYTLEQRDGSWLSTFTLPCAS